MIAIQYVVLTIQELVAIGLILATPVIAPIRIITGLLLESLASFI